MKSLTNGAQVAQVKNVVLGTGKNEVEKNQPAKVVLLHAEAVLPKEEKKEAEKKPEAIPVQVSSPQTTPVQITEKKEEPVLQLPISIEKLADKAERLFLLKQKYQEIKDKRKQVDNFAIAHDNNNAQLNLVDANGMSIKTSNPISIKKLLSDWVIDLDAHLSRVEMDMRKELAEA